MKLSFNYDSDMNLNFMIWSFAGKFQTILFERKKNGQNDLVWSGMVSDQNMKSDTNFVILFKVRTNR